MPSNNLMTHHSQLSAILADARRHIADFEILDDRKAAVKARATLQTVSKGATKLRALIQDKKKHRIKIEDGNAKLAKQLHINRQKVLPFPRRDHND